MAYVSMVNVGDVLYGPGDEKIGKITDVISEESTLQPQWYEVKLGTLGGRHLVPVGQVAAVGDRLVVPYGKELVKTAPAASGVIPLDSERELLYDHYQWRPAI
jgi:PRC-barrel domain